MAETIAQRDLRNDITRILARVRGGEEFIITVNGEPVAELRQIQKKGGTPAFMAALAKLPPLTEEQQAEQAALDAEVQEMDHDEGLDPWEKYALRHPQP